MSQVIDLKFCKPVSSTSKVQTEEFTKQVVSSIESGIFVNNLKWTICSRLSNTSNKANYFKSFNLPCTASELTTDSSLSKLFPELQQLNVDTIWIAPIPASKYSEKMDGRSFTITIPIMGGSYPSSVSTLKLVSSTYTGEKPLKDGEYSPLLGEGIAYLFCDSINTPFTGNTIDSISNVIINTGNTSFDPDPTNYKLRPSAISYRETRRYYNTYNSFSDTRTNTNFSVSIPSTYPDTLSNSTVMKYDIPVGFVNLNSGFVVLTHTGLTSQIDTTHFLYQNGTYVNTGDTDSLTDIYYTGTTGGLPACEISFTDINVSYANHVVCVSLPKEHYVSNNSTFNKSALLSTINGEQNFTELNPVYFSQIGLHNILGETLYIAKLNKLVEKNYVNTFSFSLQLEF